MSRCLSLIYATLEHSTQWGQAWDESLKFNTKAGQISNPGKSGVWGTSTKARKVVKKHVKAEVSLKFSSSSVGYALHTTRVQARTLGTKRAKAAAVVARRLRTLSSLLCCYNTHLPLPRRCRARATREGR